MMDLFESKNVKPMLIVDEVASFDSADYIFELKLDGERCVAYLDETGTELRNKRNMRMVPKVPELVDIHRQTSKRCILDGELMIMTGGKPDFEEIKRRSLTSNKFKIEMLSKKYPATFTAYDILYYGDEQVTAQPLMERKELLERAFTESERLARSRFIEEQGIALFDFAKTQKLEGIVAKRKNSIYKIGANTKDWVKIKNLKDDDFVVCGYVEKENVVASVILGQYDNGKMIRISSVTLGLSRQEFEIIKKQRRTFSPFDTAEPDAVYIEPVLVCVVKFMEPITSGGLRQPVFKGLRFDKTPAECIVK